MTANERDRRLNPRRRPVHRGRERRGAVAIIVALLLVALIGFTAFAIDFGQTFVFRAQLQTAADAGAMAGALELLHDRRDHVPDSATKYAAFNRVSTSNAAVQLVEAGKYSDAAGDFESLGNNWTDPAVNAVRVTTFHDAPYTFAPIFGLTTRTVRAVAVGAVGSVTSSPCMKPWAVPMQNVLQALGKVADPASYPLTDEDIDFLRDNKKVVTFKISSQANPADSTYISGNFYAVQYGPIRDANGNLYEDTPDGGGDIYRERISAVDCKIKDKGKLVTQNWSGDLKIGDWLYVENGNMVGPTTQGVEDICGKANGQTGMVTCDPAVEIDLPIWGRHNGHKEVQVTYVGKFMMTGYNTDGTVYGYLTAKSTGGGGFSGTPGPIQTAALVK